MTVTLRYAVRSDIGLLREGNEDSAYAGPHLLAVADGMGGHAAGEVASAAAISALIPLDSDTSGMDMLRALADAVTVATETLRQITADDPATEGMGTTLTALLWAGDQVAICHIGDSRAYLLRDGELRQITHDHTLVQSMVDEGRLTAEAATTHPQRSLVMRALQSSGLSEPDLEIFQARAGDRYLLCSDGLSDVVTQDTLGKTLTEYTDLDEAAEQLIDLAIRSGGPDNISCVLADVLDAGDGVIPAGQQAVIQAGAVADGSSAGDLASQAARTDSPAARAHLLTRSGLQRATAATDEQPEPGSHEEDAGQQATGRRLPVVRSVLVILVLVIAAGGLGTWRYAQDSWYVGADGGHVALFRGVSQPVAGIRLSSLYQRTDLSLSAIPDASQVRATITASDLHEARQIVLRIRHDYQCRLARTAVSRWARQQAAASQRKGQQRKGKQRRSRSPKQGSPTKQLAKTKLPGGGTPAQPASAPRPLVPAFCPLIIGTGG